jgi:rhodanese-related sulfurtransferase
MYREGHIPGSVLIAEFKFDPHVEALRAERRLIVAYCSCPAEETSLAAVQKLAKLGITNVRALVGGYRLWAGEKNPIATGDQSCNGPLCPLKKAATVPPMSLPQSR